MIFKIRCVKCLIDAGAGDWVAPARLSIEYNGGVASAGAFGTAVVTHQSNPDVSSEFGTGAAAQLVW
jgi:hypothetical protein